MSDAEHSTGARGGSWVQPRACCCGIDEPAGGSPGGRAPGGDGANTGSGSSAKSDSKISADLQGGLVARWAGFPPSTPGHCRRARALRIRDVHHVDACRRPHLRPMRRSFIGNGPAGSAPRPPRRRKRTKAPACALRLALRRSLLKPTQCVLTLAGWRRMLREPPAFDQRRPAGDDHDRSHLPTTWHRAFWEEATRLMVSSRPFEANEGRRADHPARAEQVRQLTAAQRPGEQEKVAEAERASTGFLARTLGARCLSAAPRSAVARWWLKGQRPPGISDRHYSWSYMSLRSPWPPAKTSRWSCPRFRPPVMRSMGGTGLASGGRRRRARAGGEEALGPRRAPEVSFVQPPHATQRPTCARPAWAAAPRQPVRAQRRQSQGAIRTVGGRTATTAEGAA